MLTRFTNAAGEVGFADASEPVRVPPARQGYVDAYVDAAQGEVVLQPMTAEQEIASYPSNVWLSQRWILAVTRH